MYKRMAVVVTVMLCGCAKSSTMSLSNDTFRLTTSAAPICGSTGAQNVAARRAAIETINHGYDRFRHRILIDLYTENTALVGWVKRSATQQSAARLLLSGRGPSGP